MLFTKTGIPPMVVVWCLPQPAVPVLSSNSVRIRASLMAAINEPTLKYVIRREASVWAVMFSLPCL